MPVLELELHSLPEAWYYIVLWCVISYHWASEASPTLGCSIKISRDIYKTHGSAWNMTRYFTSSDSIVMSRRRVEIQSTSEMSPYFTMTKCNKLFITYLTRSTERLPSLPIEYLKHFNHFNDGSYDYVIKKAVTKTIRMLSV